VKKRNVEAAGKEKQTAAEGAAAEEQTVEAKELY
jgi:hypothetical protein